MDWDFNHKTTISKNVQCLPKNNHEKRGSRKRDAVISIRKAAGTFQSMATQVPTVRLSPVPVPSSGFPRSTIKQSRSSVQRQADGGGGPEPESNGWRVIFWGPPPTFCLLVVVVVRGNHRGTAFVCLLLVVALRGNHKEHHVLVNCSCFLRKPRGKEP